MDRWSGILKVPVFKGSRGLYKVAASLCISSSSQIPIVSLSKSKTPQTYSLTYIFTFQNFQNYPFLHTITNKLSRRKWFDCNEESLVYAYSNYELNF